MMRVLNDGKSVKDVLNIVSFTFFFIFLGSIIIIMILFGESIRLMGTGDPLDFVMSGRLGNLAFFLLGVACTSGMVFLIIKMIDNKYIIKNEFGL
jgi:hypothetical protein